MNSQMLLRFVSVTRKKELGTLDLRSMCAIRIVPWPARYLVWNQPKAGPPQSRNFDRRLPLSGQAQGHAQPKSDRQAKLQLEQATLSEDQNAIQGANANSSLRNGNNVQVLF